MKYDMIAFKYLEPFFLSMARNKKAMYTWVCGSGTGQNGSGMTSKYEESYVGLLRH